MVKARVWKYGDSINTDYIFPGVYTYVLMSESEMGSHAMEGIDRDFTDNAQPGDIIVAGSDWGCGSSREQAVKCLKARGITAVIAKDFARIFFRNAVNEAFPVIICPEAVDTTKNGETIEFDLKTGTIKNSAGVYHFEPYPEHIKKIFDQGGLIPFVRERIKRKESVGCQRRKK